MLRGPVSYAWVFCSVGSVDLVLLDAMVPLDGSKMLGKSCPTIDE